MYLYHASRYGQYDVPDWSLFRHQTDFGAKVYFSTEIESAEYYSEQRSENEHAIAEVEVPTAVLRMSNIDGLSIVNYSYDGTVSINESDGRSYQEIWSMNRQDMIGWTRQVLANRRNMTYMLRDDERGDIIIGPQADNDVTDYMKELILYEDDFEDDEYLLQIYEYLKPQLYTIQLAFNEKAFNLLIGSFVNKWIS